MSSLEEPLLDAEDPAGVLQDGDFLRRANTGANFRRHTVKNMLYQSSQSDPGSHTPVKNLASSFVSGAAPATDCKYASFDTIDWENDQREDMKRRALLESQKNTFKGWILNLVDSAQGWVLLVLVAITSGLLAGLIDIGSEWMSDIRLGYCSHDFTLSNLLCCTPTMERPMDPRRYLEDCAAWVSWADALKVDKKWQDLVNGSLYCTMSVAQAVLACWLCVTYSRFACGSGIAEVKIILGGFVMKKFLGGWALFIKVIGLTLSVGSGLNLGKEGPLVHVAACVGNVWARVFPKFWNNEAKKREILSASSACGVAVAFGAPVGGVLFSLEEMSSYFGNKTMFRSFICAVSAATFLKFLNPLHNGKIVMYEMSDDYAWRWFEVPIFAILGTVGGALGSFFIWLNVRLVKLRKSSFIKDWPMTDVAMITLITAILRWYSVFLRGDSSEMIGISFSLCHIDTEILKPICNVEDEGWNAVWRLLGGALFTIIMMSWTFSLPIPAGLFVPSLVAGGLLGRALGVAMLLLQRDNPHWFYFRECKIEYASFANPLDVHTAGDSCITPGIYGIVGAAAVLGGVTRMTVALAVIMFEITGGLAYMLPIMIGVIFCRWAGEFTHKESVYQAHIELKGLPYLNFDRQISPNIRVDSVMTSRDLCVLYLHGNTVEGLKIFLSANKFRGFPVLTSEQERLVVGYIRRSALEEALREAENVSGASEATRCILTTENMRMGNQPGGGRVGYDFVDISHTLDDMPLQVAEHTPVARLYELVGRMGLRYALVTRHGRLMGILKKKDVLRANLPRMTEK